MPACGRARGDGFDEHGDVQDMMVGKDYQLQIKVKNGPFMRALAAAGYVNVRQFCLRHDLALASVGHIANLSQSGFAGNGWRPTVLKVAKILKVLPEDLYPPQHIETPLSDGRVSRATAEVDLVELEQLTAAVPDVCLLPDESIEQDEAGKSLAQVLLTLRPREERIIRLKFGLGGCDQKTYTEIGDELGLSRERVRQIGFKALRKLKHPSRADVINAAYR